MLLNGRRDYDSAGSFIPMAGNGLNGIQDCSQDSCTRNNSNSHGTFKHQPALYH